MRDRIRTGTDAASFSNPSRNAFSDRVPTVVKSNEKIKHTNRQNFIHSPIVYFDCKDVSICLFVCFLFFSNTLTLTNVKNKNSAQREYESGEKGEAEERGEKPDDKEEDGNEKSEWCNRIERQGFYLFALVTRKIRGILCNECKSVGSIN